jgi:hypothetical protein
MRPVQRNEIIDYQTYEDRREKIRAQVLKEKDVRRVHVEPALTFLFETTETIRYQIQEMMRVERIVKESEIEHEIETYNEVLGGPGEIGCTLLIEIDDAKERAVKLHEWRTLPESLYARLEDGTKVRPKYDARQVGEERLSSVQYLKFPVQGRVPVAFGADHPALMVETMLTREQRAALAKDLDR